MTHATEPRAQANAPFLALPPAYSGTYRLAIDTGTSTIGWAIYDLTLKQGKKTYTPRDDGLIALGVRAFNDGREPAKAGRVGTPKAVARRTSRGMRRNRDRKQARKRLTCSALVSAGLLPSDEDLRSKVIGTLDPLECRNEAAKKETSKEVIGRALFHLGQRRGFKSNRKELGKDEKEGKTRAEKISALEIEIAESGAETLGVFLYQEREKGHSTRFREESAYFSTRRMYQDEFRTIQRIQSKAHPDISEEAWDALYNAIFFQRPLKPVERGRCTFYPFKDARLHAAMPSAERYRIAETMVRLKWIDEDAIEHPLSEAQYTAIWQELHKTQKVSFSTLRKLKSADKKPLFPSHSVFNLEGKNNSEKKVKGAVTFIQMSDAKLFGPLWQTLSIEEQDKIVETLMEADQEDDILPLIKQYDLTDAQIRAVAAKTFDRTTLSIGMTFARQAAPLMEEGYRYDEACQKLGFDHSKEDAAGEWDLLPYYGVIVPGSCMGGKPDLFPESNPEKHYGKIANPSVHVTLNQIRVVVNDIVERIGYPPEQIVVEVGRDVKNTAKGREDIMKKQAAEEKTNERLQDLAKDAGIPNPDRQTIERFRAWERLNKEVDKRCCLYCGNIISAAEIANGYAQIDHILPFSRSYDDSRANKTLAHLSCNKKKGNKTPYEAFGDDETQSATWRRIVSLVAAQEKSTRWRFQKDAMVNFEKGTFITDGDDRPVDGFIARQLTDNHYIARVTRKYLRAICPNVWTSPSRITAMLRGFLRLNMEIGLEKRENPRIKDRSDNRHNALDAAVIGLVDRGLLNQISASHSATGRLYIKLKEQPDWLRPRLKELLNHCLVSHKPDHAMTGQFYNETAYGRVPEEKRDPVLGDLNLVARKGFASLNKNEMERIRDPFLRRSLHDWLEAPDQKSSNRPLNRLLEDFASEVWPKLVGGNTLRRVRLLHKNDSAEDIPSAGYKAYTRGEYAFIDIWRVPRGKKGAWKTGAYKYEGSLIDYRTAAKELEGKINTKDIKPHPAAKHVMRLFKQDMVAITDKDGVRTVKVVKGFYSDNRLNLADQHVANAKEEKFSINKLIGEAAMVKLLVSPCGAVRNPAALTIQPTGR